MRQQTLLGYKHATLLGGVHKLRLQILPIFDHLPTSVYIWTTTYLPRHVNVVCERPLKICTVLFWSVSNTDVGDCAPSRPLPDRTLAGRTVLGSPHLTNLGNQEVIHKRSLNCCRVIKSRLEFHPGTPLQAGHSLTSLGGHSLAGHSLKDHFLAGHSWADHTLQIYEIKGEF